MSLKKEYRAIQVLLSVRKAVYRILRLLFLTTIGLFAHLYRLRHPDIWIFYSRTDELDGNAYAFYKWVEKENKKECYFVLDKNATAFEKQMLPWRSIRHIFLSAAATVHIFDVSASGDMYGRRIRRIIRLNTKYIFLQHGMTRVDIPLYHYDRTDYDLFITTGRREHQFARKVFGYPENRLALTGQARHDDLLKNVSDKKYILIMPTWRKDLRQSDPESFLNSEFYIRFQSLLENQQLKSFLQTNQLKLRFYLHYMIRDRIKQFSIPTDINIYDETDSVHELIRDCSLLITDYSSVSFDAALAGKPVIYYQFQQDQYNSTESYFQYDKDGFGPVMEDEELLLEELRELWNGCCFEQLPIYKVRKDSFFEFHDTNNCQRIYDRIITSESL